MKITFLLTQSLESPSGGGRYGPLAKELVRLGHEVTVLALHHNLQALTQRSTAWEGVHVRYVAQMHVLKVDNTKVYFSPVRTAYVAALAALRLTTAALRIDADVYHLGKPHPMNGLAALVARGLRRRPIYLDVDDYEAASNRFATGLQQRGVRLFEDRLPAAARGITTNTMFSVRRLEALGYPSARICYVPNGVDRDRFEHVDAGMADALRAAFGIDERPVVLYLGSMSLASHPVDLLLRAFAAVCSAVPDAVLVLVGGGEDFAELQRLAAELGITEAVRFVGRVPPDDAVAYYHMADISVDPVHDDLVARARSPLKLVESLACATPVVTGDVGDRRATLNDGELGLLVAPGSEEALATGMMGLLQDAALRQTMATRAQVAREAWYWDRLVHRFAAVYDQQVTHA